jgi:hypothetical protein
MTPMRRDDGSALVELVWLSLLLMVPLVYVVLVAAALQRAAFATTAAARDAGRAYATAADDASGEARAELAARVALADQHVAWGAGERLVECGECTFAPGSTFRVVVRTTVALPWIPRWMCGGHGCPGSIPVSATHVETIDCYRATGAESTGAARC